MHPLGWAVLCSILAIIAIVMEVLTPTFGGFTFVAFALAVAATFAGFQHSDSAGVLTLAFNFVSVPLAVLLSMRVMRHSPLALNTEQRGGTLDAPDSPQLQRWLNQTGTAATPLKPAGVAILDGQRVGVVSNGTFIDVGTRVKVTAIDGTRVVVEPLPETKPPEEAKPWIS